MQPINEPAHSEAELWQQRIAAWMPALCGVLIAGVGLYLLLDLVWGPRIGHAWGLFYGPLAFLIGVIFLAVGASRLRVSARGWLLRMLAIVAVAFWITLRRALIQ